MSWVLGHVMWVLPLPSEPGSGERGRCRQEDSAPTRVLGHLLQPPKGPAGHWTGLGAVGPQSLDTLGQSWKPGLLPTVHVCK